MACGEFPVTCRFYVVFPSHTGLPKENLELPLVMNYPQFLNKIYPNIININIIFFL